MIDLGDATLLPGLIDAHVHLTSEAKADWYKDTVEGLREDVAERALRAVPYAERTLLAGFTTVRNLGADDYIDVGLRNAIAGGVIRGPRMLIAVHALGARGGHCDLTGYPYRRFGVETGLAEGIASGPDQFRDAVRYQVKYGADVIKVCGTGGVLSLGDTVDASQVTQDEMNAIVDEAHRLGRKVAVHAHGNDGARTFPPEIRTKAQKMLAARTRMFKAALKLGVKIAFGTDSGVSAHGTNAVELGLMVGLGMTPAAALRSATAGAADLLGLGGTIGTLEPGKAADVIAVTGDPLKDIKTVEKVVFVMKGGAVVKQP